MARDGEQMRARPRGKGLLHLLLGLLLVATVAPITVQAASLPVGSKNLTVFKTCTLSGTPPTSTVEIGTYVDQGRPTQTFGGNASMLVLSKSGGNNNRVYVRFDLSKCNPSLPSTASVKLATLRLYVSNLPAACRQHDAFRVTASWTQSGITWNNQPFGTSSNNPPSAQATATMSVGPSPCQNTANNSYVSGWIVTADVQAFVAGTATNNGWMIRDDVEDSSSNNLTTAYSAKENNSVPQSPQLIVTYIT